MPCAIRKPRNSVASQERCKNAPAWNARRVDNDIIVSQLVDRWRCEWWVYVYADLCFSSTVDKRKTNGSRAAFVICLRQVRSLSALCWWNSRLLHLYPIDCQSFSCYVSLTHVPRFKWSLTGCETTLPVRVVTASARLVPHQWFRACRDAGLEPVVVIKLKQFVVYSATLKLLAPTRGN